MWISWTGALWLLIPWDNSSVKQRIKTVGWKSCNSSGSHLISSLLSANLDDHDQCDKNEWRWLDSIYILTFAIGIAIRVQSWSSSWKRTQAWFCWQPKWSVFCTGCTQTPTRYVLCCSRHETWGKGLVSHILYLLTIPYLYQLYLTI